MKGTKYITLFACIILMLGLCSFLYLRADDQVVAIRGGKLVTITKGDIDKGVILIKEGKIAAIGKDIAIPEGAKVIDAEGCIVLPGLIDSFTNLGTVEAEGISGSKDYDEATSPITPHMRVIDALNPESKLLSVARMSGVTAALSAPGEGNLLTGQSALIRLTGNSVEEMVVKFPVAVHGSMGEAPKLRYGGKGQAPSTRMGIAALLRQTFIDAQDYLDKLTSYEEKLKEYQQQEKEGKADPAKKPAPPAVDFKLQSLIPIIKGELPLIVRANRMDDILTALRIAEEFKLKIILNHGADAHKVAAQLAAGNIPVIVGPLTPYRQTVETSQATYENAAILNKAGVKIAFQTGSVNNVKSLLYEAGLAVAHGLPYDQALRALTINPAEMFGVADELGSLEVGKWADVVIFEGDPLNPQTHIKMVIVWVK